MTEDRMRSVAPRALDPSARLCLVVFCAGQVTARPIPQIGEIVIGRGEDATVRIEHATVSRKHATIVAGERDLTIRDHGSFNGTSLGGKRILPNQPMPFVLGVVIELGETMVVVQVEGPDTITGALDVPPPPPRTETSPGMQHLYRLIDNIAPTNISVMLRGEAGTRSELVVEELHRRSARANRPIATLSCATFPEQLLERELFGSEADNKPGLIENADGGTLFLDDVTALAIGTQGKLLRLLDTHEAYRLGATRPRRVDVRFITATRENIEEKVAAEAFLRDLYFRLTGASIVIPALRERVDETPRLAIALVNRFARELKKLPPSISDAAMAVLKSYHWPGDVRELEGVMRNAVSVCKTFAIAPEHLGLPLDRTSRRPPPMPTPAVVLPPNAAAFAATAIDPNETAPADSVSRATMEPSSAPITAPAHQNRTHAHQSTKPPAAPDHPIAPVVVAPASAPAVTIVPLGSEREVAQTALAEAEGDEARAAAALGISIASLRHRLS